MTLEECSKQDTQHGTICAGLFQKLHSYKFVVNIAVLRKVMRVLYNVAKGLQERKIRWREGVDSCGDGSLIITTKKLPKLLPEDEGQKRGLVLEGDPVVENVGVPYKKEGEIDTEEIRIPPQDDDEGPAVPELCVVVSGLLERRQPDKQLKLLEGLDGLERELVKDDELKSLYYMMIERLTGKLEEKKRKEREQVGKLKEEEELKKLQEDAPLELEKESRRRRRKDWSLDTIKPSTTTLPPDYKRIEQWIRAPLKRKHVRESDHYDWEKGCGDGSLTTTTTTTPNLIPGDGGQKCNSPFTGSPVELGSGEKEGVSDEKENKRKDRRGGGGGGEDGAHRPPMHPDAKHRKQTRRTPADQNGKHSYYNAKNSQASIYKPSDAENIDRADASCTKFINDDLDSEQDVEGNFDGPPVGLGNIELQEHNGNNSYHTVTLVVVVRELGSGEKEGVSDEKENKCPPRKDRRGGGGEDGAHRPPMHPDAKHRKQTDKQTDKGRTAERKERRTPADQNGKHSYYNARKKEEKQRKEREQIQKLKNSQASIYKPSDAENIDRADASCTKFINDDLDSEQDVEGNFDGPPVGLGNIELQEHNGNNSYHHQQQNRGDVDLDKLMYEIESFKVSPDDIKRKGGGGKTTTSGHGSGGEHSSEHHHQHHQHPNPPPPGGVGVGGVTADTQRNVINLYPQPPPGKAARILVTER
eukprot:sb/3479623/